MKKPLKVLTAVITAAVLLVSSVGAVFAESRGIVVTELLNVRVAADMEAEVADRLAEGTEVKVTDTKEGWYQIAYGDGKTGWVVSEYMKVDFDVVQSTADDVNIRKNPSTDAPSLTKVNKFDRFIVVGAFNDWFKIKLENGSTGWINDQYAIITGIISRGVLNGEDVRDQSTIRNVREPVQSAVKMAIKGNRVNFRAQPDLDADVVSMLEGNSVVTVLDNLGEWRRVKTSGGATGYINKMFLKEIKPAQVAVVGQSNGSGKTVITNKSSGSKNGSSGGSIANGNSSGGANLIAYAKQFMGIRYKWGGTTTKGFDCSGYVQYIMRHFGVSIPRVSRDQARSGTAVNKENLRVGDLVFFAKSASNRTVNHVGMYIGSGNFIHSSSGGGGKGVTVSNLNSGSYARRYTGARRYL